MTSFKFIKLFPQIAFLMILHYWAVAQTNFKSVNYLYNIAGNKTVSGIHNREPNSIPSLWTDSFTLKSEKTPGLWSGDFLFVKADIEARWSMIYEAEKAWNKGSLMNIMRHTCSPAFSEPRIWDKTGFLDLLRCGMDFTHYQMQRSQYCLEKENG